MKLIRSFKRWEIVFFIVLIIAASSAFAAWFVASEKLTVSNAFKSLTAATYKQANSAQIGIVGSVFWSCDPVVFVATSATGFPATGTAAAPYGIWLDSRDKIRNFRVIRSTVADATLYGQYFE